jgi:hypothetical protein
MQSAQRTLLLCLFSLTYLSGCDSSDSGSSSGVYTVASTDPTGGTGGGGSTGPGGFSGPAGGTTGTKDVVVATPSVPGTVSVTAGANQTVSVTFTSSDGRPIHGLGITSTTLPADWSGTDGYSCTLVGNGSSCVLNLTYAPAAAENGTVAVNYIFINNAGQEETPGGTVTIAYVATTANNVVAASSPIGQVTAALGAGGQPVSVNFTTDDGNAATNLTLTTDLSSLPAGWTSTASAFTCAIVSTGSGCQLPLHFAPTAAATGTLVLNYTYSDNSGTARTGTLNVPYSTTTDGTIVATVSPAGQVNAVEKTGSQAVTITFTTDDGKTASNLMLLSKLTALPAGWTAASDTLSCGSVGTGNGCQLTLNYAPSALTSGTLSLNYSYLDAGGTYNVGSFNVPYAATTNDNVVGTAAPSGQISAIVGEVSPTVAVTFTTDDGRPATALEVTTNLASLPAGWTSGASSFTCSGINGGTAECVLPLTFTPTVAANGSLMLAYKYNNDAGEVKTGTVSIPYVATTNNTVDATASQNSVGVLTGTTTPITVTFVTDDGNPASALSVTSGLSPLPAGWSSGSSTFTCSSVTTGTGCQISLSYAPTAADSGSLTLTFGYTNNSGIAKTGNVAIPYTATVPPPPGP